MNLFAQFHKNTRKTLDVAGMWLVWNLLCVLVGTACSSGVPLADYSHPDFNNLLVPVSCPNITDSIGENSKNSTFRHSNGSCPAALSTATNATLGSRSTCPWEISQEFLPTGYIPPVLNFARCLCYRSVGHGGTYRCEEVRHAIVVLKPTGCSSGFYTYEKEQRTIAVGCTNAKPRTRKRATNRRISWSF
ncbi:hypothetical protein SNE40_006670 [Patella caerulea]|uniref:Secreted protein n=1 Tax=Patella caerulea TaxID=87958 RepID=A0AAN8JWV3_PATCE